MYFCPQHNHKTVQEVIADQTEADQREYYLGQDRDGNDYLHFPQFCGQNLRIYRRARVPSPEVEREEEELVEGSILPLEKIKEHRKMMKKFRHVSIPELSLGDEESLILENDFSDYMAAS